METAERFSGAVKELWQKAVQGDKDAEDAIFSRLRERFAVIAGLITCEEDAKDIAHDACLAVLKGYKSIGGPQEYSAWAQKILKNKIADYFARRTFEKKVFVEDNLAGEFQSDPKASQDVETLIALQRCLKELAAAYPQYALALRLRQSGYETDTICRKMKVTRSNLYVLLNRGRAFLRDCIFD